MNFPWPGTFITEWDDGKARCEDFLQSSNKYTVLAEKLVAMAKHYGFEGWLINIENKIEVHVLSNLYIYMYNKL